MKPTVVITAPVHPYLPKQLTSKGYKVKYMPEITAADLLVIIPKVTGLVVTTRIKIDDTMLLAATNLKWIGRLGSGMELIDTDLAKRKKIKLISTPEGNCNAVAEHVLGLMLVLSNHLAKAFNEVKNSQWLRNENRGTELRGKVVGIIGYGHTGKAVAKVLQGFGVTILAHDKYKKVSENATVKVATVAQIQQQAHIISLHLPLTAETNHYANDVFFRKLKKQPILINASRGQVVDTNSLINALKQKQIVAAGLDVIENEKLSTYNKTEKQQLEWLCLQPNVIITPHIAGYSHESLLLMAQILIKKLGLS